MSEVGRIKKIFRDRGYGFILYSEGNKKRDVFFHFSGIKNEDKELLAEGQEVEFEVREDNKGQHAVNIKIVNREKISNHIQGQDHFLLPIDTRKEIDPFKIDNFSLRINRAPYFMQVNNKSRFIYELGPNNITVLEPSIFDPVPIAKIQERYVESIKTMNLVTSSIEMLLDGRMVVGLGGASVYGTSMTLHHIYGLPYIPGTAVKGVTRSSVISEKYDGEESNALQDEDFCIIFGSPANSILGSYQGAVRFFDAFPIAAPTLSLDIMNPHYGSYYSDGTGKTAPTDDDTPNPINFLTVEETKFTFTLGVKRKDNKLLRGPVFGGKMSLNVAMEWLVKALTESGIGAKSSVGYGYFFNNVKIMDKDPKLK
jgi:CRISPR-associated protein Cmr6